MPSSAPVTRKSSPSLSVRSASFVPDSVGGDEERIDESQVLDIVMAEPEQSPERRRSTAEIDDEMDRMSQDCSQKMRIDDADDQGNSREHSGTLDGLTLQYPDMESDGPDVDQPQPPPKEQGADVDIEEVPQESSKEVTEADSDIEEVVSDERKNRGKEAPTKLTNGVSVTNFYGTQSSNKGKRKRPSTPFRQNAVEVVDDDEGVRKENVVEVTDEEEATAEEDTHPTYVAILRIVSLSIPSSQLILHIVEPRSIPSIHCLPSIRRLSRG